MTVDFSQADPVANIPPPPGTATEIAPGILWIRLALPFLLNHVNIYLVEDHDGWAMIDTGLGDDATQALWSDIFAGPLSGMRISRIIATHHHPDHMGMIGRFAREWGVQVLMPETEFLLGHHFASAPGAIDGKIHLDFYKLHGMAEEVAREVIYRGHRYRTLITGMPEAFQRISAGDRLRIGARTFDVMTGGGHSSEQAMLHCPQDRLFFGADQVLPKITPNISVAAIDPSGDPLGLYLRSLRSIRAIVPDETLVLPGHGLPFRTLHGRIDEMLEHHRVRCQAILDACHGQFLTASELVPYLFTRTLDLHQLSFAFTETLAHVNLMLHRQELHTRKTDGLVRFSATELTEAA